MIRIVVNSPKGGVGKTTLSLNLALLLARAGKRVWALDLAGRSFMSRKLKACAEFAPGSACKVEAREMEELPTRFSGAAAFDYLVTDTDDYFKITANIADPARKGWRMIAPILADDPIGLEDIPRDLATACSGALLSSSRVASVRVVANRHPPRGGTNARKLVHDALDANGIASLLADTTVPHSAGQAPYFIDDPPFRQALESILREIGEDIDEPT